MPEPTKPTIISSLVGPSVVAKRVIPLIRKLVVKPKSYRARTIGQRIKIDKPNDEKVFVNINKGLGATAGAGAAVKYSQRKEIK